MFVAQTHSHASSYMCSTLPNNTTDVNKSFICKINR